MQEVGKTVIFELKMKGIFSGIKMKVGGCMQFEQLQGSFKV